MRHLNYMNAQNVNEVSRIWISTELNPVEGENIWQDDQQDLQITLQEVINMIDMLINVSQEETMLVNISQEKMMLANVSQEETMLANVSQEEMMLANVSQKKTLIDNWFD